MTELPDDHPIYAGPTMSQPDAPLPDDHPIYGGPIMQGAPTTQQSPAPATPNSIGYVAGQGAIGLAQGGRNVQSANDAELMSMGIMSNPLTGEALDPNRGPIAVDEANKAVYGGNGQVIAPNKASQYIGSGVNALGQNPLVAIGPGGVAATVGTLAGGTASEATRDAIPDAWKNDTGWRGMVAAVSPTLAGILAGTAAGGLTAAGQNKLSSMKEARMPSGGGIIDDPKISGYIQTPAMQPGANQQTIEREAMLMRNPATAPGMQIIRDQNNAAIEKSISQLHPFLREEITKRMESPTGGAGLVMESNGILNAKGAIDPKQLDVFIKDIASSKDPQFAFPAVKDDLAKLRDISARLAAQERIDTAKSGPIGTAFQRYAAGHPTWLMDTIGGGALGFAAEQASPMLNALGAPGLAHGIAGTITAARLGGDAIKTLAGPRARAAIEAQTNQLGSNYTHYR